MTTPQNDSVPAAGLVLTARSHTRYIKSSRYRGFGDAVFRVLCQSASVSVIGLVVALVAVLIWAAWPAIEWSGIGFLTSAEWHPHPSRREFGALAFVYGTVVTSTIAMLIAIPLGVGSAAFLAEIAPHGLRRIGAFLIEMLAAIPSVVYGFWGMRVFVPAFTWFVAAMGGPEQVGTGLLPAGLVLGIMILPYAAAVSFDVIRAVPRSQREAAFALGSTRWQTIWRSVLPFARPGIIGGCFLALGRALGETMAVTMLIGNVPGISLSLFGKGYSIASAIANDFIEATYDLHLAALVELGLVLLLVSVGFSALGRILIWRMNRRSSMRVISSRAGLEIRDRDHVNRSNRLSFLRPRIEPEPRYPRRQSRSALWMNRLMSGGNANQMRAGVMALGMIGALVIAAVSMINDPDRCFAVCAALTLLAGLSTVATMGVLGLCLMITTVPLFLILGYLLYQGATALNWDFFVKLPAPVGELGGGMANGIYGSCLMIGVATAFSLAIGLPTAIYLAEYRSGRLGATVRFIAEMLGSVPSIVIGIFGYYAIVRPITGGFSALAGAFALGIMMLPIIIRASEEALKLVPGSLKAASHSLGAAQWQTVLRVSVPAALPAIITAVFLGIARVAGETAPLMLTASSNLYWPQSLNDATPSLPMFIFDYARTGNAEAIRQAWAAAFVLVSAIMVLNVTIRLITGKRVVLASQAD
jgi:phosphate transport system permease protein